MRQEEIPGTEGPRNKEVDDAAEAYNKAKNERVAKSKIEVTRKRELIEVMKKHDLTVYTDRNAVPPIHVVRSEKSNVKTSELEGGDKKKKKKKEGPGPVKFKKGANDDGSGSDFDA